MMSENYTKGVQRLLKYAKEEAIRFGHTYVGSEHILLAIIKDKIIQVIWSDLPTAIEITSSQLHKYYLEYFEQMWKQAKK